jgi:hypothetical protein
MKLSTGMLRQISTLYWPKTAQGSNILTSAAIREPGGETM